ncbi:MAG: YetF domain-containing protein, partial [Cyclobacteriaceae bacterium]
VSGKRTLTKMNAFDFVITIALGSTLAAVSLNKNIALIDGLLAFFIFIFLQFGLTWLSVRFKKVKNIITSSPSILVFRGELMTEVMKRERITIEEINMAVRKQGFADLTKIDVVVLETTGDISIIQEKGEDHNALEDVQNFPITKEKKDIKSMK